VLVSESGAVTAAGAGARVYRAERVTYAIGPDAMVVIVDSGDRPGETGVQSRHELTLISPFPFAEGDWPDDVPTLALARLPAGCVALGPITTPLESADIWANLAHLRRGPGERGDQRPDGTKIHTWRFAEPLPFDVLDLVRGTEPHPDYAAAWADLTWLDLVPRDRGAATKPATTTPADTRGRKPSRTVNQREL
jgi:hypothetical protein